MVGSRWARHQTPQVKAPACRDLPILPQNQPEEPVVPVYAYTHIHLHIHPHTNVHTELNELLYGTLPGTLRAQGLAAAQMWQFLPSSSQPKAEQGPPHTVLQTACRV